MKKKGKKYTGGSHELQGISNSCLAWGCAVLPLSYLHGWDSRLVPISLSPPLDRQAVERENVSKGRNYI